VIKLNYTSHLILSSFVGYSLIENPWACLPFEALEAVTASLAITAASTYAVALSSLQTIASIQGIMGCLYFGIGRGAGSLLGGILIKEFGHRSTFQIFGAGSLVGAILYSLINVLYLRKHSIAGKGLDINNLNNADPNHNHTEVVDPAVVYYDGPLEVNKFTDIPLDEEVNKGQQGIINNGHATIMVI
jgi:MFS family permease